MYEGIFVFLGVIWCLGLVYLIGLIFHSKNDIDKKSKFLWIKQIGGFIKKHKISFIIIPAIVLISIVIIFNPTLKAHRIIKESFKNAHEYYDIIHFSKLHKYDDYKVMDCIYVCERGFSCITFVFDDNFEIVENCKAVKHTFPVCPDWINIRNLHLDIDRLEDEISDLNSDIEKANENIGDYYSGEDIDSRLDRIEECLHNIESRYGIYGW